MFCEKCGNQLPEGATFCSQCGARVATENTQTAQSVPEAPVVPAAPAPAAAPAAAPAQNPMIARMLSSLRSFFSTGVTRELKDTAQSQTHEWAIFLAAYLIGFALMVPVNLKEAASKISMVGSYAASAIPFGSFFGLSLLVAVIANAALVFGTYFQIRVLHRRNVSLISVLNTVEYASLPVIFAFFANLLLGLIWTPLTTVVLLTAVLMQVILLYVGLQKLAKLEKSPFYGFSLVLLVQISIILGLAFVCYKAGFQAVVSDLVSSSMKSLGGMLGGKSGLF